jgi:plastocyanin
MRAHGLTERGPQASLTPARAARLGIFTTVVLAACGGDSPAGPAGPPTQLEKSGGDGQAWFFDNPLPESYGVVVRDADGGPVEGVTVSWTVTAGGGSVDPLVSVTNGDGSASTTHTLGPAGTSQTVTASVTGLPEVEFEASASSPPTSAAVTALNTNQFSPRNVVVQIDGTVTWTWGPDQTQDHNVIFGSGPAPRPPDSPTQRSGTYSAAFTGPGLYEYFCNIHAGMHGTVRVVN